MKALRIAAFAVMAAAILAAPASLIVKHERVLREGRAFRFRNQPVDPYDAFRGRYVQLRFDLNGRLPDGLEHRYERDVYARFEEDEAGFARVAELSAAPFTESRDYVKCEMGWWIDWRNKSNRLIRVQVPFHQFYMNENLAPEAEAAYARMNRGAPTNVWVTVRVLDGKGAIENLYFEGLPARDYLLRRTGADGDTAR